MTKMRYLHCTALLNDMTSDVREAAAYMLESYDPSTISSRLFMLLSSEDISVKRKSISVIGYYSNEEAEEKLQEIINSNDQNEEIKDFSKKRIRKITI